MSETKETPLHADTDAGSRHRRIVRRGRGRRVLAVLATAAAAAAVVVPATGPEPTDAVGTLETSMVDMLDDVDVAGHVTTLRDLTNELFYGRMVLDAGQGVDVAVIDTGVAPVNGLDAEGKVLHGPDLSFEGSSPQAAYLDTYGHGTHIAGIIAGERSGAEGIAPGARIVSLKVAGHDGVTTVPQVVAAIDWVVEHRNTDGLNIRVLNLSLGQAGVDTHVGDPLSAAVERAWDAGIVVVVAAGNRGETQGHLDSPAIDPYAVAVGASQSSAETETEATLSRTSSHWGKYSVPSWSALGDGLRDPDVIAPGRSVASYRVPGSTIDQLAPQARYGDDLFLGSGTSQSAAIASGVLAALIQRNPGLTPDEAKAALERFAHDVVGNGRSKDGSGIIDGLYTVYKAAATGAVQKHPKAAGSGTGIVTPAGATWSGGGWSGATWSGATWSGATWSGATWSGATWSGATWSGATWSGATWSGATWSGATWSGATWSGGTWSGATWSGKGWS